MAYSPRRVARVASLDAARALYFIIAGLSVRESLLYAGQLGWDARVQTVARGVLVSGFLLTLFRYSHGVAVVYDLEKKSAEASTTPSLRRTEGVFATFSLEAVAFFLMAQNLGQPFWFVLFALILLVIDLAYIHISRTIRGAFLIDSVSPVFLWRRLRDTADGTAARTHIVWSLSNLALGLLLALTWLPRPKATLGVATGDPFLDWQIVLGALLLAAAAADYWVNARFYFGGEHAKRTRRLVYVCGAGVNGDCRVRTAEEAAQIFAYCEQLYRQATVVGFAPDLFYSYFLGADGREGAVRRRCSLEYLRQFDEIHFLGARDDRVQSPELVEAREHGLRVRWVPADQGGKPNQSGWAPATHTLPDDADSDATRRRVFVCSPLRGNSADRSVICAAIQENIPIAQWLCHQLAAEKIDGEYVAPIAPQAFYPFITDLTEARVHEWVQTAIELLKTCDTLIVYNNTGHDEGSADQSVSEGMRKCIQAARELGLDVSYRRIKYEAWALERVGWPKPPSASPA